MNLRLLMERKAKGSAGQQLRNEALLRRLEIALARSVKNARDDFVHACADACLNEGERHFDGQAILYRSTVKVLLDQQAGIVIPRFGRLTRDDIRRLPGVKSRNVLETKAEDDRSFFDRLIQRWAEQRTRETARQIAGTSLDDVIGAVTAGIAEGAGTAAIARAIRAKASLSPYRALLVARTETHAAATFAQAETALAAETRFDIRLVKQWLPTLDSRTRDAHAAMANHPPIPLDEKFIVGGVPMDRPGDPAGGAANCIRCRCSMIQALAPD